MSCTLLNNFGQAYENTAYLHANFASFLINFNIMLLHTYLSYLNETFRAYSKRYRKLFFHTQTPRNEPFSKRVNFADMLGFHRLGHN